MNHHYSQHCYEPRLMLSVKEFMKTLNKNQFVLKNNFTNQNYPNNCHIHFDDDSLKITNCRVSTKEYSFIIDGTTESGHEVKLFWGDNVLKY